MPTATTVTSAPTLPKPVGLDGSVSTLSVTSPPVEPAVFEAPDVAATASDRPAVGEIVLGGNYRTGAWLANLSLDDRPRPDEVVTTADAGPFSSPVASMAAPANAAGTDGLPAVFDGRSILVSPDGPAMAYQLALEAGYDNEVGLYFVDDAEGRVDGLAPGDAGYAYVALAEGNRVLLRPNGARGAATSPVPLTPGARYGFYLVQNDSYERWAAMNSGNALTKGPLTFFSFVEANTDGVEHVRPVARGGVGFEDLTGGGDLDFDDFVAGISPTKPPVPPVPPSPAGFDGRTIESVR
jgi:hypothetical protein